MNKNYGLIHNNFEFFLTGAELTVNQLKVALNGDNVYKSLCGASDKEVEKTFEKTWTRWLRFLKKKSYRKAKIVENILNQIVEYHTCEYEKEYMKSYIDFDRFK